MNKTILAMGTIEDDNVKVNEEIKIIYEKSKYSKYIVTPCVVCTVDVFNSLIDRIKYDYIHIAGHGLNEMLNFVNSNISAQKFGSLMSKSKTCPELLVLNCCFSTSFIDNINRNIYFTGISYPLKLYGIASFSFSDSFYNSLLLMGNDIITSFNNSHNYKYILH